MRELQRRLKAIEERSALADSGPVPTLADFYQALNDPAHPDHEDIYREMAHFYGGRDPRTFGLSGCKR
jgi:hypothetical protein